MDDIAVGPLYSSLSVSDRDMCYLDIPATSSGLGSGRMRELVVEAWKNVFGGTHLTEYTNDPRRKLRS